MQPALERILVELLERNAREGSVDLDGFAMAIGALAVTADEIDELMAEFESKGGILTAPEGGGGQGRLKVVLEAARTLRKELGRVPSPKEISARTGLDIEQVRRALALGRTMG
jgi:hypothetical protein